MDGLVLPVSWCDMEEVAERFDAFSCYPRGLRPSLSHSAQGLRETTQP